MRMIDWPSNRAGVDIWQTLIMLFFSLLFGVTGVILILVALIVLDVGILPLAMVLTGGTMIFLGFSAFLTASKELCRYLRG